MYRVVRMPFERFRLTVLTQCDARSTTELQSYRPPAPTRSSHRDLQCEERATSHFDSIRKDRRSPLINCNSNAAIVA